MKINLDEYVGKIYGFMRVDSLFREIKINDHARIKANCTCLKCGNTKTVLLQHLIYGHTRSCGCLANSSEIKMKRALSRRKSNDAFQDPNDPNCVLVKLSNSESFMRCDKASWMIMRNFYWYKNSNNYAASNLHNSRKHLVYHRELMECPKDMMRDHINKDRLDNRYENLRVVSPETNSQNLSLRKDNTTGYTGVSYHQKDAKKYRAEINTKENGYVSKSFDTLEEAVDYRKILESMYFKEKTIDTKKLIQELGPGIYQVDTNKVINKYHLTREDIIKPLIIK